MSYAGFPNVAAPSFWGPLSGRANRTDTSDPPQPIVATLNSMWDGTKYFRPFDDADPSAGGYWLNARFAPAAPTLVSTLYVDSAAGSDSLAILAWDENGDLLTGEWTGLWNPLFPVENLGDFIPDSPRRIYSLISPRRPLFPVWNSGGGAATRKATPSPFSAFTA